MTLLAQKNTSNPWVRDFFNTYICDIVAKNKNNCLFFFLVLRIICNDFEDFDSVSNHYDHAGFKAFGVYVKFLKWFLT